MPTQEKTIKRQQGQLVITKAKELPHGQFEAILSTDDLDRHGEHVDIKGIKIPAGQVIKMYYNHETTGQSLPIGKWLKVWKKDGKLYGLGEVDLEDEFAVKVYKKIKNGFIDSISIGFYPEEYDGESSTWTKSTLVEASVVAEPANVNAVITSKDLGFSNEDFEKSLEEKAKSEELVVVKTLRKGAVTDILTEPKKWELMKPYYDIIFAFEDAYYNEDTPATEFSKLLNEAIGLLQQVSNGTYDLTKSASDASGAAELTDLNAATETLKSEQGALEAAAKAANENPTTKTLIKVRLAAKQVDKAAEEVNRVVRIKLKETTNV